MKAISLLLLRASTGLLLMIWGGARLTKPELGQKLSDTYYSSIFDGQLLHQLMGGTEALLGLLVLLGLFRKIVYPLQTIVLGFGLFAIWRHILDPLGIWLQESSNILFFPSTTIFFATLVMLAFKEYDVLSLDEKMGKNND